MKRIILILTLAALALSLLSACGEKKSDAVTSLAQLREPGRIIGVETGTGDDAAVREAFPDAEIRYVDDSFMAYSGVASGKLDAFVYGKQLMELAIRNGTKGVKLLDETVGESHRVAVGISPVSGIPDLETKLNAFIDEMRADGTLDDMYNRWVVLNDESMPDIAAPEHTSLRLRVATTGTTPPYTYYVGTELRGYDIELARRFAAWLGAELELIIYDYSGAIAAAQSGDADCIMAEVFVTPERAEALPFSHPVFLEERGIAVRDTGGQNAPEAPPERWQDYNGRRIGVLTGTLMEEAARTYFPDSEYLYFNSYPDCNAALLAGKIDAYLGDEPNLKTIRAEQPKIDYIRDRITNQNYSFAFRKNDPESAALCSELNEFLAKSRADGTLQEIDDIWMGIDEDKKVVDMSDLTGINGTVRVITTSTDMPWSYIKDGKNVGYDIDLVVRFCRDRGYALELGDADFSGRIPAIQSGKYDFTTDMNVTPERAEQVLFSDPTSSGGIVLAVLAAQGEQEARRPISGFSDLEHARIGVTTGSVQAQQAQARFPDAEFYYFSSSVDSLEALRSGKIDAYADAEALVRYMMTENRDITVLDEWLAEGMQVGAVFPKTDSGRALCDEFSAFIRAIKQNGVYDEIQEIWFGADESRRAVPDLHDLPAVNGTLRMAADTAIVPFVYIKDGEPVGIDVDTVVRFCKERGYGLEIVPMDFAAIIPAVVSGKVDFAGGGIAYTPERAESVLYSEPTYLGGSVLAVRKAAAETEESGFLASIRDSFEKTFVRENRWKLFLEGVGTTLLITVLSILFGTALGFAVFLLCRKGNPVANAVTRLFVWLINGMPMVVLLMVLYYIIFGRVAISGTVVSVIGFTLVFGSAVYAMVKGGVATVDKGQTEAAYSLGYTDRRAFFRVVLPQSLPHIMPSYKGQITALIKATAIVGYVAVQDLTKMGDIVRSRTYEAFFPLIAVAVIYFVLAAILTWIVNALEVRIDPRKRNSLLKGVETGD